MNTKKQKWLVQHQDGSRRVNVSETFTRGTLYNIERELFRLHSYKLQMKHLSGIIDGANAHEGNAARAHIHKAVNRLVNGKFIPKYTSARNIEYERACIAVVSNFKKWSTLRKYYDEASRIYTEMQPKAQARACASHPQLVAFSQLIRRMNKSSKQKQELKL